MLPASVGRLVRATWQHNTCAVEASYPAAASRAAAVVAGSCCGATSSSGKRPISGHQRRHSSSKTPISGDGVKVVGRTQRAAADGDAKDEAAPKSSPYGTPLRSMGRRRRRQDAQQMRLPEQFSNLPSVPPTSHLDARDIGIASFFSQHRPISITSSLPAPTSTRAFDSIFDPSKQLHSPDSIESTRQKMRQILLSFRNDDASSKAHLASTSDPNDAIHLDGLPPTPQNLDRVLQGAAYRPPPPPSPGMPGFGAAAADAAPEEMLEPQDIFGQQQPQQRGTVRRSFKQKIQRKSWSTTIIVTETTDNTTGGKSYATTNSPIVQIPLHRPVPMSAPRSPALPRDPYVDHPPTELVDGDAVRWRQPFLQRMWLRQRAFASAEEDRLDEDAGIGMLLISVKRQRKLKMKKHKYKKLMRRTRSLRRKLGKD